MPGKVSGTAAMPCDWYLGVRGMEKQNRHPEYLYRLNEVHDKSGLSLREVARACDLDPSYVHYILKGARRPQRDVIIAMGFAYGLERIDVDEILLLANLPPLGRGVLREYRQVNDSNRIS
jgi:transcriptional regulator with XRE-family HTH domain